MGIKYSDLEIRWISVEIKKLPTIQGVIKSEIGYYDPQSRVWISVREGPTITIDEMFVYALSMLQSTSDSYSNILDSLAYGILSKSSPFYPRIQVKAIDSNQNEIQATGVLEVPGRDPITFPVPSGELVIPMTARAKVTVNYGTSSKTWTGPLVRDTVIVLEV